jgi:transcriptional regulator of acetoin/glycerol metabolism
MTVTVRGSKAPAQRLIIAFVQRRWTVSSSCNYILWVGLLAAFECNTSPAYYKPFCYPRRTRERARMVGASPAYRPMVEQLQLAARSDAPVLLDGETGTGKDLAANYIHQHSQRAGSPLLTLNRTGLSEHLFEAELFGHERGAFTGSVGELVIPCTQLAP